MLHSLYSGVNSGARICGQNGSQTDTSVTNRSWSSQMRGSDGEPNNTSGLRSLSAAAARPNARPARVPVSHHEQDSMRRAHCSPLPTIGSKSNNTALQLTAFGARDRSYFEG